MNNWTEDIGPLCRHTMETEKMMARLLAEMNVMRGKLDSNQDRMEAKIEAEIRTNQSKAKANQ
jgi:hypothetical protein